MAELGYDWPTIEGPVFFKYNDELLSELRDKLYDSLEDDDE